VLRVQGIDAYKILRNLGLAEVQATRSLERLSTGSRINSGIDDPAGISLLADVKYNLAVLKVGLRAVSDTASFFRIYSSAVTQAKEILVRAKELLAQAASDSLSDRQRSALHEELVAITQEANRLFSSSVFNGTKVFKLDVLDSSFGGLDFSVSLSPSVSSLTTPRIASTNSSGVVENGSSFDASLSSDGRFVVFRSTSTNLIPGVSGTQIYVKDLLTGQVSLASSNSSGTAGNGSSYSPQITPDGRFVVFSSNATNLIPRVSGTQIYVKDLLTGQVSLASSNSSGTAGNGFSESPQITPDGRFVVFGSNATNLIPGVSGYQIYVKDLLTGQVSLASSNSSGTAGNGYSYFPQITPDGRFVVFWSDATNLVSGASGIKLYVKDLSSGQVRLVQGVPDGVDSVWFPEISSDGRSIAVSFDTKSYILFNPFLVETELEVSQIVGLGAETAGQARNGLETITYFDKLLNELTSIAGSIEARLQVAASNIQTLIDNLEASSSRLSDADIAEEVSDLVAANTRQELSSYLLGVWKTIETTMAETFTNSILSTLPKDTLKDQPQKNTFTKSIYPEFYYTAKEVTPAKQAKNPIPRRCSAQRLLPTLSLVAASLK